MTPAKITSLFSFVVSMVVAVFALIAGFRHNAQSELYDPATNTIHFGYALLIFASWFIASFVVVAALGWVTIATIRIAKRIRKRK